MKRALKTLLIFITISLIITSNVLAQVPLVPGIMSSQLAVSYKIADINFSLKRIENPLEFGRATATFSKLPLIEEADWKIAKQKYETDKLILSTI